MVTYLVGGVLYFMPRSMSLSPMSVCVCVCGEGVAKGANRGIPRGNGGEKKKQGWR